jgi:hypothetical protein
MRGLLDIVLPGQGLAAVLPIARVLLACAAVFFAVSIWRFRYEWLADKWPPDRWVLD